MMNILSLLIYNEMIGIVSKNRDKIIQNIGRRSYTEDIFQLWLGLFWWDNNSRGKKGF